MPEREPQDQKIITFEFTERRAYGYPDETKIIEIPLKGKLPPFPQDIILHRESETGEFRPRFETSTDIIVFATGTSMWYESIRARWIKERGEWVGFRSGWTVEDARRSVDEYFSGPYELDEYCLLKIVEAFEIENNQTPVIEIKSTPPDELKRKSPNYVILDNLVPEENERSSQLRIDLSNNLFTLRLTQEVPNLEIKTYLLANLDRNYISYGCFLDQGDDFSIATPVSSTVLNESLRILESQAPEKTKVIDRLKQVIAIQETKSLQEQFGSL